MSTILEGTIDQFGETYHGLTIPASLAVGTLLVAQAELVLPGTGEIRRTNSVPVVIR